MWPQVADLWNYVKKMQEYIKCATGPDLWNYVKKFWNI